MFGRDGPLALGGLARDAAGGANLALAMLPKAMAYAAVAGVPPAYGLYASCAAPALAVAFGSNRLLFTGPVGVMTVLVLGALRHFAEPFSLAYIELAASLALMVGILTFCSPSAGWDSSSARSPLPSPRASSPPRRSSSSAHRSATRWARRRRPRVRVSICRPLLAEAAEAWAHRDVLVPALSTACIAIALLARRLFPRIPEALIVVALALPTTFALGLSERGVEMVGRAADRAAAGLRPVPLLRSCPANCGPPRPCWLSSA